MDLSVLRCAAAHPLVTVFVLALSVRLINLALLAGNDAFFAEDDTFGYWALGAALAKPGSFWPTLLALTDRMPLYPLLLGAMQSAFGDAPRLVALVQAVIDAGTCLLIAALANEVSGQRGHSIGARAGHSPEVGSSARAALANEVSGQRGHSIGALGALISPLVGLIAGILAALSVTLIVFSTQILTETLFLFFFTAMLLAGANFLRNPTHGLALLAGVAGGLALATRPAVAVLLVAAVPVVFVLAMVKRRSFAAALAAAVLFAVGAAAPIVPVLLRNVVHYGSFSLTSQTAEHLAFWIVPLVTQRADGTPYQATMDRVEALYRQRLAERGLGTDGNPFRRAAAKAEVAREQMARLPLAAHAKAWLEGMVVNLGAPALLADPRVRALPKPSFYNTPGASLWEKARAYVLDDPGRYQVLLVVGLIAMLPVLALEAAGFIMLARTLPWAAVFAGGVLAYFLLLNGPVATAKYRLPMEPVLIVLAAIPLARLVQRIANSK
jgi:hypothetical protein